jgi:hypothetical protein
MYFGLRCTLQCAESVQGRVSCAQVKLDGFKSYKNEILTDHFSPQLNVVGALQTLLSHTSGINGFAPKGPNALPCLIA